MGMEGFNEDPNAEIWALSPEELALRIDSLTPDQLNVLADKTKTAIENPAHASAEARDTLFNTKKQMVVDGKTFMDLVKIEGIVSEAKKRKQIL
jgi:hypothetical protein